MHAPLPQSLRQLDRDDALVIPILAWWLASSLIGWLALPIGFWLFSRLPDRGFAFSRILGLLLASYLLWLGASLHVLQNDLGGIVFALVAMGGASAWLAFRRGGNYSEIRAFLRQHGRLVLVVEILFVVCLLGWSLVRAYSVGKIMRFGGEKFMEIAFLNAILNSPQFPPADPWLSGFSISYYYFGYVMMALLTRLTGVASGIGFDLYDALLFALSATGAFGLVYEMACASRTDRKGALLAGSLGAVLTVFLGNLQGLLEVLYARGWLPRAFAEWLGVPNFPAAAQVSGTFDPGSFWGWGWRASRVLNDLNLDNQPIDLNPITEFPNFSFLLGDNHPHVLALPFALLAAAVCFQWVRLGLAGELPDFARTAFSGLAIGALAFLNTWDFPIYLCLGLLGWLVGRCVAAGRFGVPYAWDAARLGLTTIAWTIAFYLLFFAGFSSQAGGILPYVFPPTRLAQYLVMFGPFIFILAAFLPASLAWQSRSSSRRPSLSAWLRWWLRLAVGLLVVFVLLLSLAGLLVWLDGKRGGSLGATLLPFLGGHGLLETGLLVVLQRLRDPWLFLLLTALLTTAGAGIVTAASARKGDADQPTSGATQPVDPGLVFAWLLALAGLALTFSVEFAYLRDGFGVRMNTVFKFYFQGWLLMAAAAAYAVWWMATFAMQVMGKIPRVLFFASAILLTIAGLVYPVAGIYSRIEAFSTQPNLDGASELRRENPDDWAVIDWLLENGATSGRPPVILEAPGESYTYEGRISAFTGYPAVLGWAIHEMQWRGNYNEQGLREPGIQEIFTNPATPSARSWLALWQVDYIIFGNPERQYIREQCSLPERTCDPAQIELAFASVFRAVFQQGSVTIFQVPDR